MSLLEIVSDSENKLLGRRELKVRFRAGAGILSRQAAVDAIASRIGSKKENVQVLSIKGMFGTRDLNAEVYIFSNPEAARKQLAEYISLRHLPKDERKKLKEERRKTATAPAAAESSGTPEAKA